MTRFIFSLGIATVLTVASSVSAQTYGTQVVQPSGYNYGYPGYGPDYGYGGYHSSTYEEGVLRGLGYYHQSLGQANLLNSQASINNEEAYSRYLDNREKHTETYFRLQQINAAARAAKRPTRLSTEEYAELAKKQAPDRLTMADYDRAFGRINWPAVLEDESFAAERDQLNRVFASRSPADVGASTLFQRNVRQLSTAMQDKLQSQLSSLSPMEYIAAKKFLVGLAYEAQQPVATAGLAVAR